MTIKAIKDKILELSSSTLGTILITVTIITLGFVWFIDYQRDYDRNHMSEVTVTITDIYEEKSNMGCIGTDTHTIVKADDNRTSNLCGKLGKVGDKIKGCWMEGHWDRIRNGFKLDC